MNNDTNTNDGVSTTDTIASVQPTPSKWEDVTPELASQIASRLDLIADALESCTDALSTIRQEIEADLERMGPQ